MAPRLRDLLTQGAEQDIQSIHDYITEVDGPQRADHVLDSLMAAAEKLAVAFSHLTRFVVHSPQHSPTRPLTIQRRLPLPRLPVLHVNHRSQRLPRFPSHSAFSSTSDFLSARCGEGAPAPTGGEPPPERG